MFVARLDRVDGEYVIVVPHDIIIQQDLHAGQIVSIVVEPLADYENVDATSQQTLDARWKLNEDRSSYRPS